MYSNESPLSPSARRMSQTFLLRFVSSTTVSGQSRDISSSFGRRCPALRTRSTRVSKTFGFRATGRSRSLRECSATSSRKAPNS